MKKSVSLKLIVFSFLLAANVTYSAPEFQAGSGTDSTVAGVDNLASGEGSSAVGANNKASGGFSSAFGASNKASKVRSSAFGYFNIADGEFSSAFGSKNTASEEFSSAFGYFNKASGEGSSAVGANNKASGEYSSAVGANNKASGKYSSAFGYRNTASGENSSVVGSQYKVTGEASGAFGVGKNSGWNAGANEYNYDYINEGKNSYMFGNYNKIAAGTQNNFILGNNVSIGSGINNSVALGNNSTVSSSNEVSVGSATLKRKITNVADGEVSATSTDVVTGKQLYSGEGIDASAWKAKLGIGSADVENLRNEVNEKIDNVKNEVRNVGSLSAALAGLHPMQYDPKAPAQVMAALGHYKNKQSVAVGLSYYFNDRFMMSASVALSGEKKTKSMANIGFTVKLGKGSGVAYNETPQYVVQNEVKRLTVENQELKSQVNNQGRENQELKAEVNSLTIKTKEQDVKIKNLEEKLNMLLKNK
ncbi:YadA-like family protein [Fusobacterium nucleatum]|uniref:YadA-like family protein n=1 Tax=Fusobacterium nucleatum TaxID=851 RepID=UPI00235EEFAE|nr:YadA-like family protein [Fusobacterium nucleatum]WDA45105.1 YadA-like family protein [Fusobacterium nucleatum]